MNCNNYLLHYIPEMWLSVHELRAGICYNIYNEANKTSKQRNEMANTKNTQPLIKKHHINVFSLNTNNGANRLDFMHLTTAELYEQIETLKKMGFNSITTLNID